MEMEVAVASYVGEGPSPDTPWCNYRVCDLPIWVSGCRQEIAQRKKRKRAKRTKRRREMMRSRKCEDPGGVI
jgi:hypothetical protein